MPLPPSVHSFLERRTRLPSAPECISVNPSVIVESCPLDAKGLLEAESFPGVAHAPVGQTGMETEL